MIIRGIDYNIIYKHIENIRMVINYTSGAEHLAILSENDTFESVSFDGVPKQEKLYIIKMLKELKPDIIVK